MRYLAKKKVQQEAEQKHTIGIQPWWQLTWSNVEACILGQYLKGCMQLEVSWRTSQFPLEWGDVLLKCEQGLVPCSYRQTGSSCLHRQQAQRIYCKLEKRKSLQLHLHMSCCCLMKISTSLLLEAVSCFAIYSLQSFLSLKLKRILDQAGLMGSPLFLEGKSIRAL